MVMACPNLRYRIVFWM